jgi:tetratricopeptide (TPR) repeat protein
MRKELISRERDCGASPADVLEIYLKAPKEQRDSYLHNRGLMQTFMEAEKWPEAIEYLSKVDRRWSEDVKSWYDFCISYADYLVDQARPEEALQWIEKGATTPPNISNTSLPLEHSYRQHEFYLAGLAHEMMGETAKSEEFYRLVLEEPTDFLFNEHLENMLQKQRFYVALVMDKLGMEVAASGMLVGINSFRLQRSLVTLRLEKSELDRWNMKDPLAEPATVSSAH